jgi:tetratricopeptide (TPR) repeat protein
MSRLNKKIVVLLLIISLSSLSWSTPPDELSEMLARAEALYYEADFAKSVELLLRADEMLRQQSDHLTEKTDVKLQLALGYIGLNDSTRAKTYLGELYALDPDRQLDPQMFSPKVIRLADEAKAEQDELRCSAVSDETQKQLTGGNGDAVVKLLGAGQAKCPGLAALYPKAADLIFKEGLDAYKKTQMAAALQKFREALVLEPKHELAAQYVDLTQSRLEVAAERALVTWRKDFTAGEFAVAARDYRELTAVSSPQTIDEARGEYRRALTNLVDAWNLACAKQDTTAMEKVRVQVTTMLPEPKFAEDILAKMNMCAPTGCIKMDAQLALARLKNRVDPQFSAHVKAQVKSFPVRILVKARINEKGEIVSSELQGGHPALYDSIRAALDQWRFFPAATEDGGPRCVETEIPFVINFTN